MAAGSLARPTPERLVAAAEGGTLSHSGAAALADAYRFLIDLRLDSQLRQVAARRELSNRVRLDDLTTEERRLLRRALHTVRDIQRSTSLLVWPDPPSSAWRERQAVPDIIESVPKPIDAQQSRTVLACQLRNGRGARATWSVLRANIS